MDKNYDSSSAAVEDHDEKRAKALDGNKRAIISLDDGGGVLKGEVISAAEEEERRWEEEKPKRMKRYLSCIEEAPKFAEMDLLTISTIGSEFIEEEKNKIRDDNDLIQELNKTNTGGVYKQHWHLFNDYDDDDDAVDNDADDDCCRIFPLRFDTRLWKAWNYGELSKSLPNILNIYSLRLNSAVDNGDYHVFGHVHLVSQQLRKPQVIFSRYRNNCQTLTKENRYLTLTGPTMHPSAPPQSIMFITAKLALKGATPSEDIYLSQYFRCETKLSPPPDMVLPSEKDLSDDSPDNVYLTHLADCCKEDKPCECNDVPRTLKHYVLEMTRSIVTYSVMATIDVRLVGSDKQDRKLPGSYIFTAYRKDRSRDDMEVVLLDSRDAKVPVKVLNGSFVLSRRTICVERSRHLIVCIQHDGIRKEVEFKADLDGEQMDTVNTGACMMEVKVEWSIYWEKYIPFI